MEKYSWESLILLMFDDWLACFFYFYEATTDWLKNNDEFLIVKNHGYSRIQLEFMIQSTEIVKWAESLKDDAWSISIHNEAIANRVQIDCK